VYRDMDQWMDIRRRVLVEGVSKRHILRETGMHWTTLEKILAHSQPPGYRRGKPVAKPKIGPYLDRIRQILEADKQLPRKQRHTAKRIWERLGQEDGYDGGYTIVKDAVRELKARGREVFMPLVHRPGEAQVDFGFALVRMAGVLRKVAFFVMALPHSDAFFVMAFPRECTETFWEGHVRAFEFFGFVPWRISYDNTKVAIAKILGPRLRKLTRGFQQLLSHYLFTPHFCLVRRANEKGVAEGVVKFSRLNFFVPVPDVRDFEQLNGYLLTMCRSDLARRLRGKTAAKGQLLQEDRISSLPLPAESFDACRTVSAMANSEALVRFDSNDYSVPVDYAHHPVTAKGYVDRVQLCRGGKVIAEHLRCWDREQQVFDPKHYLRLIQHKPGSLDHARPLADWDLPECFAALRRRLEADLEDGTREYIRVLRLLERHCVKEVATAVERGLGMRAHTRDAIAQFLLPAEPWEATTFRLDGLEHLRCVKVACCDVSAYRGLLGAGLSRASLSGGVA
jgi:transposase